MNGQLSLETLKPLNSDQYDSAREKALERVRGRIGDKPHRADFVRELEPLWTILDVIALAVFVAALVVSSVHIITHMGKLAQASYMSVAQAANGTVIGIDLYSAIHQWAFILLAEGSMLLFLVMFGMTGKTWRKWVYLVLACAAVVFVIVANWQAQIGALESLLAPIFTIGIGLKLEHLIVQSLKRQRDITDRYLSALTIYETASGDPAKHPDYMPLLRQEVWSKLISLPTNREFRDAPVALKHAAVRREMARDTWAFEDASTLPDLTPVPAASQETVRFDQIGDQPVVESPLPALRVNGNHSTATDA